MLAKAQNPRSYSSDAPYGHRLPAREIIEAGPRVNLGVAVYAIEATGPLVWELLLSGAKRYAALWAGENHYRFRHSGHRTRTISTALTCGTCTIVSWMRWVSIVAPHGHLIKELSFCVGILSAASQSAYFRAVKSR
jgi:hypothetical protein